MIQRVISLRDVRDLPIAHGVNPSSLRAKPGDHPHRSATLQDALGRPLKDLRISVTDRCNFRCSYCMPKDVFDKSYRFLPQDALLSFEEITLLARVFARLGVRKLRLTGGEPLLRKRIEILVAMLADIRSPEGERLDLTLTTNGSLLARMAQPLRDAGLQRVTVSLDALDDGVFQRMNDVGFPVSEVLAGIDAALKVGLGPIKVNMVVKRGTNDQEIVPMARHFRDHYGALVSLRFIEFMDVGATNGWKMSEVLPSAGVLARLSEHWPLTALVSGQPGETAARWSYADGKGEIGLISSVSQAFCGDCNRARLSTQGQLFLCLFASQGHDLRQLLREGASAEDIGEVLEGIWRQRQDRYSQLRSAAGESTGAPRVEMHYIGG
jgi:cyclic pyranopterin phosphate synthase